MARCRSSGSTSNSSDARPDGRTLAYPALKDQACARLPVIDTGPVVAAANRKDDYHEQCVNLLQGFPSPLLLPAPLITEIGYMLHSRAGSKAEAGFLRDVADGLYELVQVTAADVVRAADLAEQFRTPRHG